MEFEGKVAVIVPGQIDVGRAAAIALAKHGAEIVLVDRDQDKLLEIQEEIRRAGGSASFFVADISDAQSLTEVASQCRKQFSSVQMLVNCHFAIDNSTIEQSSNESWRRVIEANVLGPVFTTKAFLPLLKAAKGAAIVNIGSIDGILGNPHVPSYSVAKGAMIPLTHVMADEFAPHAIRVNLIARGLIASQNHPSDALAPLLSETPLGRLPQASEIASVVRFLMSDDASYITGAVLAVDGGRTAITQGTRQLDMSNIKF
jgi:NAD(P)-dependent dehydrogenase (short-subunit alcohol dehydrogenase family)